MRQKVTFLDLRLSAALSKASHQKTQKAHKEN